MKQIIYILGIVIMAFLTSCGVNDGHSGGSSLNNDGYLIETGDVVQNLDNSQDFKIELTHFLDPDETRVKGLTGRGRLMKFSGTEYNLGN